MRKINHHKYNIYTSLKLKFKKVKLREDKISYEDLILAEIFSEDEISLDLSRQMLSDRKN